MLRALLTVLMVLGAPCSSAAQELQSVAASPQVATPDTTLPDASPPGIETEVEFTTPPRIAPRPLTSALHAMQNGRWEVARRLAARDGSSAETLIQWHYLSAGLGTPEDVLGFLANHPDWPGLDYLRKRSEEGMSRATPDQIIRFYEEQPPQTGEGALSFARALRTKGEEGEADATLVLAWHTLDLDTKEHEAFLAAHGELLESHHEARLDMALWRGLRDAELMLPLVSEKRRKLTELRRRLDSHARIPDEEIEALSDEQRNDPGIAHALFNRYVRRDADKAIDLAIIRSRIDGGLGRPDKWAGWRRALARDLMRDGKAQRAYDLASVHQLVEGAAYSDLEWLSGYLALTYLDDPELALDHFQRFRAAVISPISMGRAGYWIGRAQEALGDPDAAQVAYEEGAKYQTSFYGLLAAERAGLSSDPALTGADDIPPWQGSALAQSDLVQATFLARAAGQLNLAERFIVQLGTHLDAQQIAQLGQMLEDEGEVHLQVMLGKSAARRGIVLPRAYYPLHPMAKMPLPVPTELSLAIARRESEFDTNVVSGAGAEGLMQVMPGTARDVARDLGLDHDTSRMLSDWRYNARLGSTYLAQMAEKFDGNIIMIAAAYNAGPARPPQWIERFGDPRRAGETDIIDWIEHIPFRETRNYVMRVSESLPVYRARLGKTPHPVPFSKELTGATIAPAPHNAPSE